MAGRFTVESIFKGIDKVTRPVSKMSRNVGKFTRKMSNQFRKLNARIGGLTSTAKRAGAGIAAGLAIGTAALIGVINVGADFEQSLLNASAKFGAGLQKNSKEFTTLFDNLENTAASIGKKTEFTSKQAAEGLNFLALAGFSASQAVASLPVLVDLATASQIDLATASDIATDTLGAFGLTSKDAAVQAENLARVSDVLAKVTTTANTNMEDLFEAIKKGGPQFKASGASIETFGALAGTLANSSLKATEAGTGLRNFFLRIAKPTKQAGEELERLGVKTQDGNGNFRDGIDILADLEKGLEGMGTKQRAAALSTIFGVRTISSINVLLEAGTDKLRTYRKSLENSGGAAAAMAAIMRSGVGGAIKTMESSFSGLILTIFKVNKVAIKRIINGITEWIRKVEGFVEKNKVMVKALAGDLFQTITAGLKIFAGFVGVVIALNAALLLSKGVILAYNIVVGSYNAVMKTAKWLNKTFKLGIVANKIKLIAMKVVLGLVTAAQWLWNAAMSANPIGAVIALIVGLIAVGALLMANWDTVKSFFIGIWDSIVETVSTSIDSISALIETVTQPFKDLFAGVNGIKSKVSNFFGLEGGTDSKVVSPEEKISKSISESRETSEAEITIRAEKGTNAEITNSRGNFRGLNLQQSGAFN